MGLLDKFFNEATDEPTTNNAIPDKQGSTVWNPCEQIDNSWQLEYAKQVIVSICQKMLTNVQWKTYKGGEEIKETYWFKLNFYPNERQTASEFFNALAEKIIVDGNALIIETAKHELFVADRYEFKGGVELVMKNNTFVNVQLGQETLGRSFKENETCIYIKAPIAFDGNLAFASMSKDYMELKSLIKEGADKALGMKLSLNMSAQAKNKYDVKTINALQQAYTPLMSARNAVFLTYKGETLSDLTERQRGSEVQQVLEAVDNNIKINKEILSNVGTAYGVPNKFMTGEYTADNEDIFNMLITMFAKPYLKLLSEKFTNYFVTAEDVINGSRVVANLNAIKFADALGLATNIDKLIGSSVYTANEVREKLDETPIENGDERFITKNYAVFSEYMKGGSAE